MTNFDWENRSLGRYVLRHKLGLGGMASVFLAQVQGVTGIDKWVALKVIHPHMSDDERFRRMFLDEARISSRLDHPNTCKVIDFGEVEGILFIALEYLRGESFLEVLKRTFSGVYMPPGLILRIVADAARGLHAAHESTDLYGRPLELVHRDVSPHNIFVLYEGVSKAMDFGIARARGRLTHTRTGELKGKLAYMAPEQLESDVLDRRCDIFSLGVVLWEATVRRRLFRRENAVHTIAAVLNDEIPNPCELVAGYPEHLARIVMRTLERDPRLRYQTMEALADDLEDYMFSLRGISTHAHLANWMKQTFAENIERRADILRENQTVDATTTVTAADWRAAFSETNTSFEPDPLVSPDPLSTAETSPWIPLPRNTPSAERPPAEQLTSERSTTALSPAAPTHPGRRRMWAIWVVMMIVVASIAGTVGWLLGGMEQRGYVDTDPDTIVAPHRSEPARSERDDRLSKLLVSTPSVPRARPSEVVDAGIALGDTADSPPPPQTERANGPDPSARPPTKSADGAPRNLPGSGKRKLVAAPSRHPGYLNLLCIPVAEVWLGSRRLGTTPLRDVPLRPGRHVLRLRSRDGSAQKSVVVRIISGEKTRMSVRLGE